ncbi:MAG: polyphosphate kinase 1 [Chloroflexota bacterium]|nr:polyphosphate kinase 1 [Chloroflexota bacterium]
MKKRKNARGVVGLSDEKPPGDTRPELASSSRLDPALFINRELSWLEFNRRVLEEVGEPQTPLLERAKFAAIFAVNLNEFFMIRVAGIKRKLAAGIADLGPDGRTPAAAFAAIRRVTQELLDLHASHVRDGLIPDMAEAGIEIVPFSALDEGAKAELSAIFEREMFPILTPQAIDRGRRFPHVSNDSLNLIVVLRSEVGSRFARVKIPAVLPRLVALPRTGGDAPSPGANGANDFDATTPIRLCWLEQVVAAHLERLFPGSEIVATYPFHVIRDAEIEPDEADDDGDFLTIMRESLSQRTFGSVVRLDIDTTMPEDVRTWLVDQLHTADRDLYLVDGPLAVETLFELQRLDRPDLKDPPFMPAPLFPADDDSAPDDTEVTDIFALLRERDVLVHHPYQSFDAVAGFVRAASTDPDVVAIKQTLYRIGKDSPLIPALIEARDDDTQVAVLVELKARFDEENNITWAQQLERKGVHVAYGLAGLKTHCKATLVVRRERDGLRRYVHLATGNYNAATARVYEDLGLLTSREALGDDVSELFNVLTGYARQESYRKLWVAPSKLRAEFLAAIDREVTAHAKRGEGFLSFKLNSLVDREIIKALYGASQAGVRIDLMVRGVCCLRPGVPNWSETIRVRSIVGRFLEHSRIFVFGGGGKGRGEVYLGSADLMERNFDRRVEVVFPLEDPALARRVRDHLLPAYWRDTVNARELGSDGVYYAVRPAPGEVPFDVHEWLIREYRETPV